MYLNLGNRAFNQFQEIIFFLTTFIKIKKINKIVIFSGLNDIFLFNNRYIRNEFPGPIYWNNQFIDTMNNLSLKKDKTFNFKELFFELFNFKSKKKNFFINSNPITFDEILLRNFSILKLLEKSLNIKVSFVLQPYLSWCKEPSKEEKKIIKYTNLRDDKYLYKLIANSYIKYKKIFEKTCNKTGIDFHDSNRYVKNHASRKDFLFIDNVHLNDEGNKLISKFIKSIK